MNQITTIKDNQLDFILYSSEDYSLLRIAENEFVSQNKDNEIIRYEQGEFDISEIVTELGMVSFFSEKRVVLIRLSDVGKLDDDDFELMCNTIELSEACRVGLFINYADKYAAEGKRAKALKVLFERLGSCKHLMPLSGERLKKQLLSTVKGIGCTVDNASIDLLVNKFSQDVILLNNEIEKVAALSNYGNITVESVQQISTTVLSADIFALISMLTTGKQKECFDRLSVLIDLGQEPIAILAAITSSFVDIYRVKIGEKHGKKYGMVFKDFGYKGSDYRLKKSSEISVRLNRKKIVAIIKLLNEADLQLKSTSVERDIVLYRYLFDISNIISKR